MLHYPIFNLNMPKKIKRGRVGRPPKKGKHAKKPKITLADPHPPAELTVEQEAKIEEFARRVLRVRQIRTRKELFEQMNQIRKYLKDSCSFGSLIGLGSAVQWQDLWKRMAARVH